MSAFDRIQTAWLSAFRDMMNTSSAFRRMASGTVTRAEYCAVLRQIFHQVREHPQALGVLASRLIGDRRRAQIPTLLKHAISETGHDELAIADLQALEADVSRIRNERPLPATAAITGFMYFQLDRGNPVGFLGYLFHLEFLPTTIGQTLMSALESAGIPPEAQTFIRDHAEIDLGHNKLMERYVSELVLDESDVEAVCYVATVTAHLYGRMFDEAIARVDDQRVLDESELAAPVR